MPSSGRQQEPDYGAWVSWKILLSAGIVTALLFALAALFIYAVGAAILALVTFVFFGYGRYQQSASGGNMQAKLWDELVDRLGWDGTGRAIDIGCGNGAVAVRIAQKHPGAQVVGVDVWGGMWEYSKAKCEQNARAESVDSRVSFQKADAAKLPFPDGYFDAAVSNLVFHNVRGVQDKRDVLKEALRVVRRGGRFAFSDGFTVERYYHWDADELISAMKGWGIEKVDFEKTREARLNGGITIIWGAK